MLVKQVNHINLKEDILIYLMVNILFRRLADYKYNLIMLV